MSPSAVIDRIVRYPVKGLPGVAVEGRTRVERGSGIRWDRSHAILKPAMNRGRALDGWAPRRNFFHTAKDDALVTIGTALDDAEGDRPVLALTAPGGRTATMRLDETEGEGGFDASAVDALLAYVLGDAQGAPAVVRTGARLWDYPDTELSLINLASVDDIAAKGAPVDADADAWFARADPRRFRGNLYVRGLDAWAELDLVGERARVGTAVLEFLGGIARCRATTINPSTAESDFDVPAVLRASRGDDVCGVFVRVVTAGEIGAGDGIELI